MGGEEQSEATSELNTVMQGSTSDAQLARIEALLKEQLELARDTNQMLHRTKRMSRLAFWARVILWALVLGVPLLFIGPLLREFSALVGANTTPNQSLFELPSLTQIEKSISQYGH